MTGGQERYVASFERVFRLCGVQAGDACAVLSESASREDLRQLAVCALERMGAQVMQVIVPTPAASFALPVRSTGAAQCLSAMPHAVKALATCTFIADCTVEGLQHAAELADILAGGARVLVISQEHPEILWRCEPRAEDELPVRNAMRQLRQAQVMQVTSAAGTDLRVSLAGARVGGVWGYTTKAGSLTHWPGGLVLAFPAAGTVNGTLVLAPGDVNLTFKTYLRDTVVLQLHNDHVVQVEGSGVDAKMMRGYFEAWNDPQAYAVSHVGWGLNRLARWDAMTFYDKQDFNGTELRAFAGNFLFSTGANEVAGRHTAGHFDLPLCGCTIRIDEMTVVRDGQLL